MARTSDTKRKPAAGEKARRAIGGKEAARAEAPAVSALRMHQADGAGIRKRTVAAQVQSEKLVADRRERIIRAAITVFHRLGFHTATTADITREAGLTQSNLYNYVKSKQDVLFLVCEHLVSMYEDVLDEVSAQHQDPYVKITESLAAIIGVMNTYGDEVQLLYNEVHSLEEPDRSMISVLVSRFISRFETLIESYERETGTVIMQDRRLAANLMSFVPAILPLRRWDLKRHGHKDREKAILRFILRGLGIPEPA